ncbi:MATE family efflux transporter [Kribbia dieselivorans]|uniref:MATE family efflux transporter n=1 Tax=Kribbia dieselivorans TaxID=331526 RepID=UPI001FE13560|nr:MATE family efflux transporter [Kribbia dieselivorans]
MSQPPSQSREILALAVPAFVALIAEPLFLLVDSAVIGHLGTAPLAGLGVASAVLLTAANVFIFLAYGTTAIVARRVGAGDERAAAEGGMDGVWLATLIGVPTALLVGLGAEPLSRVFGASPAALDQAVIYLRISAIGLPAMLIALAATGALRGMQDTRTPLIASTAGFSANIALNLWFVIGLDMGIAGAAWGTVLAQWGMAAGLLGVLLRHARRAAASWRVHLGGVLAAAVTGVPLLVRTLALRAILLVTVWAAASMGDAPLAAYQVTATIWTFLTFALDALAIAAQALTGKALGAGDAAAARSATDLMLRWGVWGGVTLGLGVLALHRVLPMLFTTDPAVRAGIAAALVVVALIQPLSGYVFVVDGVLMGAGDGRWLARSMVAILVCYLPVILGLYHAAPRLLAGRDPVSAAAVGAAALWAAFGVFMLIRGGFFRQRIRGNAWMVTGATR